MYLHNAEKFNKVHFNAAVLIEESIYYFDYCLQAVCKMNINDTTASILARRQPHFVLRSCTEGSFILYLLQ